jgi:hypothetical protein
MNDDTMPAPKRQHRDLASTLTEFVRRGNRTQAAVDEILAAERERQRRQKPKT